MILRRRIERRGDGARLRLPKEERHLLRELVADLDARLADEAGDDDFRRLFPPAYDTAPDDEAEYGGSSAASCWTGTGRRFVSWSRRSSATT